MKEEWIKIDFATNYEVSNLGNIRNTKTGVILNPGVSGNGYKQVSIKMIETNKFKKQYVHRLVAQYAYKAVGYMLEIETICSMSLGTPLSKQAGDTLAYTAFKVDEALS